MKTQIRDQRKVKKDDKEFYLSYCSNCERDTICSEFDYIVNNVDDIDEEDMTQNHMKFWYFLEVLIDK